MLRCVDCGSTNIINEGIVQAYFHEGNMVRLRSIFIHKNENELDPKGYIASCPEFSKTACAIGDTELGAIINLGEILEGMFRVKLLGNYIEE